MEWQPIETAPADEEIRIKWPDGTTAIAIRMSPAPVEIDPDQQWWWGVNAMSYSNGDWWDARDAHDPCDATHWQAYSAPDVGEACMPF